MVDEISFNSIILYLKKFFCIEPIRIGGEIVFKKKRKSNGIPKKQMYTTIRISGKPDKTILGDQQKLKKVLSKASKHFYMYLKPHILAYYYYSYEEDNDKIIDIYDMYFSMNQQMTIVGHIPTVA